jgi:Flp pilus assembly protein TadG
MKPCRLRSQRGVALVEFALLLPFLIILLVIVAEIGRAIMTYDTLTRSVRDAARYLSMRVQDTGMTEARNLVVYGKTSPGGGDSPVVPGLTLGKVPNPTWQPAGATPTIVTVSVRVSGYAFTPMISSVFGMTIGPIAFNDIVATMRSQP